MSGKREYDILIVDDNPVNLDVLSGILTDEGYRYRVATTGERALSAAATRLPDLILLDITMPVMDGYEVCRRLKADHETADVPVIFVSALDEGIDKVLAFQVGGADYVTKPFQFEEVLARIAHQLRLRDLQQSLEERNEELVAKNQLLEEMSAQLERANQELSHLAVTDALTGVSNRRRFHELLESEWARARRSGASLSVLMTDVDHFKKFNDGYGHQAGDDCLRRVAEAIRGALQRNTDFVARYGGEEFVVVLPESSEDHAMAVARKVCEAVRSLAIGHEKTPAGIVSVSIGVHTMVPRGESSPEQIISLADQALYRAKSEGRDRAIAFDSE